MIIMKNLTLDELLSKICNAIERPGVVCLNKKDYKCLIKEMHSLLKKPKSKEGTYYCLGVKLIKSSCLKQGDVVLGDIF